MLPLRTILHPTDFSECSCHARDLVVNLAKDSRARLVLLHVVEPPNYSPELAIALPDPTVLRSTADAELQEIQHACKGIYCERIVTFGYPASEIVRVAGEIKPDLIVLGTHGRTGFGRLVMGSVAEEVIRRAPCPVLATKPSDVLEQAEYEDWIAAAMGAPECRGELPNSGTQPESMARSANASYAATIEHTVRTTNRWLRDVRSCLVEQESHQAFRLLRAVLHALRDHLSIDHVASLAAQLPLLLRGVLYEGWDPTAKRQKQRHGRDFIEQVKAHVAPEPLDQPERAIRAVLSALGKHLTPGEVTKLQRALPHEIRDLWDAKLAEPIAVH